MKKLLVGVFAACAAAVCACGATLEVGTGKAYETPAAALAAANDGDVILLADETFVLDATLEITKAVTFRSASGDRSKAVISGNDAVPLVYIPNTVNKRIVFDSITLTKGAGTADLAAGITLKENTQQNMQLFVTNCVISFCVNSVSNHGGAGRFRTSGNGNACSVSFIGCEVCNNSAIGSAAYTSGGLGFWYSKNALIENCDIHHNTASASEGGGLKMFYVTASKVRNCRIYENSAAAGGGALFYGDLEASGLEICDNTASGNGGGCHIQNAAVLRDSKVCGNKAATGGGIYLGGVVRRRDLLGLFRPACERELP